MNLPKVTFLSGNELEDSLGHYLCYLGKQISCGYYSQRRMLLLPKPLPNYGRAVYFPDLNYQKEFWANVGKYTQNDFTYLFDPKTHALAKKLIFEAGLLPPNEEVSKIAAEWRKFEAEFFDAFKDVFPTFDVSKIGSISCTISKFGTQGSFEFQKHKNGTFDFKFTHRIDVKTSGIAEKILSEFIYMDNPILSLGEWEIRENTVDFVLLKTKIGQIFNFDFQPTVSSLPELSENEVLASEKYFQKLGFPLQSVFSVNRELLTVNGEPVHNTFTQTEKRILLHLIQNKNKLISYDEVGNLFWGEEESLEKFSLVSIAKIMEKIRRKIREHGIYQEMIYTIRSQGYVLYD